MKNLSRKYRLIIGDQVWMDKNLDVDKFRNGDLIPEAKTNEKWENAFKNGQPAWCYYEYSNEKYGRLYNWYAVNDPRGLAPEGWHIPSDEEWKILSRQLGGKYESGSKMKSTSGWENDGNGTTESGFSGLPGGKRNVDGSFHNIGYDGYWWTTNEGARGAWYQSLSYYDDILGWAWSDYGSGFSVRCVKD